MFFRWLHKGWKYFWGVLFSLLLVLVIIASALLGLLQLDVTKDYIVDRIEERVERSYHAQLSVGEFEGFLPFQFSLHDVVLTGTDSLSADTLASFQTVNSRVDVWGLLQNRLIITDFSMDRPRITVYSDEEGRRQFLKRRERIPVDREPNEDPWFSRIEVIAPTLTISEGTVFLEAATKKTQIGNLPQSFSLTNIDARFFVDWSEQQRYLDIESFSAQTRNLNIGDVSFSGQVYSDQRYLEFNSFYVNLGNSRFILNGEIDGVNLVEPNFTDQLLGARYNLGIRSDRLRASDLRDLIPAAPQTDAVFTFDIEAEGTTDSLYVDYASVGLGESLLALNGSFKNLRDKKTFSYDIFLDEVNVQKEDVTQLNDSLSVSQYRALENLRARGEATGTLDSVDVDLQFDSPLGRLTLRGQSQLVSPYKYGGTMAGENLNISPIAPARLDTTSLNFDAQLSGHGFSFDEAMSQFTATFYDSHINNEHIDRLALTSSLSSGFWQHEYDYQTGEERFDGSGSVDFSRVGNPITMRGNAENIDLKKFVPDSAIATTSLNFDYNVEVQGVNIDHFYGRANLDIRPSVIGGDSVRAHQFYMDLNSADEKERSLRLTSSLFDMNINGDIIPTDVIDQIQFWAPYLRNRFHAEILMDSTATMQPLDQKIPQDPVVLEGNITAKDLQLVQKYLPDFPTIETDSEIVFSANTDGTRLLLSAEMQADTIQYNSLGFSDSRTQMTASFRSDRTFKDFSTVDLEATVGSLVTPSVDVDSLGIDLAVKQDSVHFTQSAGSVSQNARFNMAVNSSLADSSISVTISDFFLGNDQYAWVNQGEPSFIYHRSGPIDFSNFSFQNRNEYFGMQGRLSKDRADSLTYILRDINLNRISDLVKGKVEFAGVLNGTLVTRSLTRQPTIQGDLDVNRLQLNERLVGDLSFDSRYDPTRDRFDTRIDVITDSTKYDDYLDSNDEIGQNIRLDGYFVTPNPRVEQDTVFYFDADFDQIDMWVLPLLLDNIFMGMEGQASGEGYITGNMDDFDFHADFDTENVLAKPRFVNTNYFVNGSVELDRTEGVTLDSLDIMDTKGGSGIAWGNIDLNNFDPITYLDLTLDMDRLQFLNNKQDPDVPFFGNVSGTGVVRLTGANNDLYMRTQNPVQVTNDSEISIPLLEETELSESGKFIQFVNSFEEKTASARDQNGSTVDRSEMNTNQIEQVLEDMTFSERFDLDLQFEAPENVTVNLLFDPVTGEILTAQGTGQMRLNMQDQDVQMFGRYAINSGNYQFVTGEIISRRLELEPGGTIVWEGEPDNARLDISAVYNARPNIATLTSESALESQSQTSGQQVPIELIVEINGTLNSVENNYYFRLPSSLDLSSNSTLQYTINQINRDEQQKLFQATSILFSGQFIPTEGAGNATASLSQNLTRGATVLNPLLSNQVISPLLSNQINALLNSDVSRLDVDFNLNAYNEVDLGIALRLYNDRLILRREGQITGGGTQNSLGDRIGDLNATYRIQRGLSLTAFHRQDQVLNSLGTGGTQAGDVTPSVDGIGLESQIQYNSWKELFNRIRDTFNSIFGIKNKENNNENDENKLVKQEATTEEKEK